MQSVGEVMSIASTFTESLTQTVVVPAANDWLRVTAKAKKRLTQYHTDDCISVFCWGNLQRRKGESVIIGKVFINT